jgi:hypothetical protein
MKKIITIFTLSFLIFSCTKDLEEHNINKKDFATTTDAAQFNTAQQKLFTQMTESNVNLNIFRLIAQQWTETTYTDESRYDLKSRRIDENHWEILYKDVIKNLIESKSLVTGLDKVKTNKLAILELYEIYTYYVLVTSFGDIPYKEALNIDVLNPIFDNQKDIIYDLLVRIDTNVIDKFDTSDVGFSVSEDIVYNGDISKWKKFANSLKLQMGVLLADVDVTKASSVVSAAITSGVFTSADDNMKIRYDSTSPYTNPVYAALVLSGRDDFVPTATMVNMMNSLNDPRRDDYFSLKDEAYLGAPHGVVNLYGNFSHVSEKIANEPTLDAPLMTYFEVEFLIAEAIERGFTTGSAADHYDNAVEASILYWGGTSAEVDSYISQASVDYTTSIGNYKQKIGTQKWLALYNRGFEAWTEWRRLDFPVIAAPADAETTNGLPPLRLTYPTVELSLNETNLKAAGTSIGGDQMETKLFWDIN